jgi:hypothetical protein
VGKLTCPLQSITRLDSIGVDYVPNIHTAKQCGNEFTIHRQQINRCVYRVSENIVHTKRHELDVVEYIHDNSCVC